MYEGMTDSAQFLTKLNTFSGEGASKSSKYIPPIPLDSPIENSIGIIFIEFM